MKEKKRLMDFLEFEDCVRGHLDNGDRLRDEARRFNLVGEDGVNSEGMAFAGRVWDLMNQIEDISEGIRGELEGE